MYFEDSFGARQSPSLAEAMRQTPQLSQQWFYSSGGSTPNTHIQASIKSNIGSSSQQLIEPMIRCSPTIVEPMYNSQPQQIIPSFDQSLEEIEKKLCIQLDETLRMNYKKMKNKIKKVKYRVQQTDGSIHRIKELIETVYEHIDEIENLRDSLSATPILLKEASQNDLVDDDFSDTPSNIICNLQKSKSSKKITWRRGNQNKYCDLSKE